MRFSNDREKFVKWPSKRLFHAKKRWQHVAATGRLLSAMASLSPSRPQVVQGRIAIDSKD